MAEIFHVHIGEQELNIVAHGVVMISVAALNDDGTSKSTPVTCQQDAVGLLEWIGMCLERSKLAARDVSFVK